MTHELPWDLPYVWNVGGNISPAYEIADAHQAPRSCIMAIFGSECLTATDPDAV